MARTIGLCGWTRRAGVWLAALALAFKVAIPAGFMVGTDSHNRIAIVLCSEHGGEQVELDLATGQLIEHGLRAPPATSDDNGKHSQICPFAGAAIAATAPAFTSIAAPQGARLHIELQPLWLRPQLAPTGPPLPARGPPQIA
jgi:hypothetical protein